MTFQRITGTMSYQVRHDGVNLGEVRRRCGSLYWFPINLFAGIGDRAGASAIHTIKSTRFRFREDAEAAIGLFLEANPHLIRRD